jgi:hypothetical protein
MEITFDGHKMRDISAETPSLRPRITSVVLLSGDTHVQTEEGKFGTSLSFSGVANDWSEIVAIGGKLGFKGTLITPEYTFNGCAISNFSSSKIRGSGSKYKYEISFVKEGGGF